MTLPVAVSIIAITLPSASLTNIGWRPERTSSGVGLGAEPICRFTPNRGLENQLAAAGETAAAESTSTVKRLRDFMAYSISRSFQNIRDITTDRGKDE